MQEEPLDWDDAIDPDDLVADDEQPSGAPDRRTRWWALGGLAIATAFVVSVVLSTGSSSVPVGGSGSMAGMTMSMGDGPMAFTMRDVDDRTVRLPGARAGVVVFAAARDCAPCVASVRAARDAVLSTRKSAQLIVVMADSATSREDVAAFKRAVRPSPARYVVDDRNSGLASMLGAPELGSTTVMTRGETSWRTLMHACRNSPRRCATPTRGDLRRAVDHPAGDRRRQQAVADGESRTCSYDWKEVSARRVCSAVETAESASSHSMRSGGTRLLGRIGSGVSRSALPRARARQLTP